MERLRSIFHWLLGPAASDPLVRILRAWRLWLVGALLGGLLAWGVYGFFPPPYRARATVVVDFDIEGAWSWAPDRQLFYYLERETRKLEELAWSDATLSTVADQFPDLSLADMRGGGLILGQPGEGPWAFWAQDADPHKAEALASAWAEAFIAQVHLAIAASPQLEAARAALQAELLRDGGPDPERLSELSEDFTRINESTQGISPYLQVALSQSEGLPVGRSLSLAAYLFVGSFLGASTLVLLALFSLRREAPRV